MKCKKLFLCSVFEVSTYREQNFSLLSEYCLNRPFLVTRDTDVCLLWLIPPLLSSAPARLQKNSWNASRFCQCSTRQKYIYEYIIKIVSAECSLLTIRPPPVGWGGGFQRFFSQNATKRGGECSQKLDTMFRLVWKKKSRDVNNFEFWAKKLTI